jgi:hypothetical protein
VTSNGDYNPEPRTQAEYLSALWRKVTDMHAKLDTINGRVNRLERFMWALGGGLLVIAAVVVPQWLGLLKP